MPSKRTAQADRVRRHTSFSTADQIDAVTRENVRDYAGRPLFELDRRIAELEGEWDVERTLETNASLLALTGAILGTTLHRGWFWLTGGVLGFLLQHATSGWCPPLPVLRKLGVRTQAEIDQEKFALKAIRGDFNADSGTRPTVDRIVQAVSLVETQEPGRDPDRVRRYTSRTDLEAIDAAMVDRIKRYAHQSPKIIAERIGELRREWSIERHLQVNASLLGLSTLALAVTSNRKWGFVTCLGLGFLFTHAVEGFDPQIALLRRRGIRSRAEIDREIYALKALRGDFDEAAAARDESEQLDAVLAAVGV